jgi:hypothetical protein
MILLISTSSIVISLTSWLDLYNSSAPPSSSSSTLKLNKDENVHRYAVIGEKEIKEREIQRQR